MNRTELQNLISELGYIIGYLKMSRCDLTDPENAGASEPNIESAIKQIDYALKAAQELEHIYAPPNINEVKIYGWLPKDPELNHGPEGEPCCTFSIIFGHNQDPEVRPFEVICWDGVAEHAANHLYKGRRVYLEGKLNQYICPETGEAGINIVATNIRLTKGE